MRFSRRLQCAASTELREALINSRRIMVKLGSAVVTRSDGAGIALGRMANIVEQVSHLQAAGREMIVVSSGAVAAGRQILRNQKELMEGVTSEHLPIPSRPLPRLETSRSQFAFPSEQPQMESAQCAAVGQSSLMALYDAMFKVYGMGTGQVLINIPDLERTGPRQAVCNTIEGLVSMRMVPVVNENDAIQPFSAGGDGSLSFPIADNDAVAAVLARELKCDLLLLLSNVDSVYTGDPSDPASEKLSVVTGEMLDRGEIAFASKSSMGRGGMESKVSAARYAMDGGVKVVIGNGLQWRSILDVVENTEPAKGTLFC